MRIAIVHDWLDTWRGGENTLAEIVAAFPDADLFALVDFLPDQYRPLLLGKRAHTSFLQNVPGAATHFRKLLPLFPRAIESLDVGNYDVVISVSHAVAKGVRTTPNQLHVCYCLTPMRYAWDLRDTYLASTRARVGLRRRLAEMVLNRLQLWDLTSSARVSQFVAISEYIRQRVHRCYGRESTVIYPPVDTDYFTPDDSATRGDYYFTASKWVPYKRIDLIVQAFRTLPERRLVVAGDGPDAARIRAAAGSNVEFVGALPREQLRDRLRSARAFIFGAEEDFGIVPLEAQSCGTPVIAYGRGGVAETLRGLDDSEQPTGVFFAEQSAKAIGNAVRRYESNADRITSHACRANTERYSGRRFRAEFTEVIELAWRKHR